MTGASGIFTPLPGAFLYSQYHFWNAEAKSGWSRGFHLAAQVATLAGALKSFPFTSSSPLPNAALGIACLAGAARTAAAYVLEDKRNISQETSDRLTTLCNIFDKYSHRVFQICFIAATSLTLYKERGLAPLTIGLVSIVADRMWFGKTPIRYMSADSWVQRIQELCRLIFVVLSFRPSTALHYVEDPLLFYHKASMRIADFESFTKEVKESTQRIELIIENHTLSQRNVQQILENRSSRESIERLRAGIEEEITSLQEIKSSYESRNQRFLHLNLTTNITEATTAIESIIETDRTLLAIVELVELMESTISLQSSVSTTLQGLLANGASSQEIIALKQELESVRASLQTLKSSWVACRQQLALLGLDTEAASEKTALIDATIALNRNSLQMVEAEITRENEASERQKWTVRLIGA